MKLQVLLHSRHRNSDGIAQAKRLSEALGIHPTAEGEASISAEVNDDRYKSLFGEQAPATAPGPAEAQSLPIPESLKEYVQDISIAPSHIYLNRRP